MSATATLFALVALTPAALGSSAAPRAAEIALALCNGGSITIPTGGGESVPGENAPCCAKACHATCSRKRMDRAK